MNTFADLSAKQQAAILQILELFPSVRGTGQISLSECKEFFKMGKSGKIKPACHLMFLYGDKQYRTGTRGLYSVPMPTSEDVVKSFSPKKLTGTKTFVTIELDTESPVLSIDEFEAECLAAGIM